MTENGWGGAGGLTVRTQFFTTYEYNDFSSVYFYATITTRQRVYHIPRRTEKNNGRGGTFVIIIMILNFCILNIIHERINRYIMCVRLIDSVGAMTVKIRIPL